jgi:hypothetical protein
MTFIKATTPEFGNVEAYAKRHRRLAPIVGTSIVLSLQEADRALQSASLQRLRDGDAFNLKVLSSIVPSLRGLVWEFRRAIEESAFALVTVTDDVEVSLSVTDALNSAFLVEGALRGIAARIVVALDSDLSH